MSRLFKAEITLEKPGELPKSLWTGEAILSDEDTRRRFVIRILGSSAMRYADDHHLTLVKDSSDLSKFDMTDATGAVVATMRLTIVSIQDRDGWIDKPNCNGMWWYVGRNDEGEEIMGIAMIELEGPHPIKAILGSCESHNFDYNGFVGPWKKAVVPQPAGWNVEHEHDDKAMTPVVVQQ